MTPFAKYLATLEIGSTTRTITRDPTSSDIQAAAEEIGSGRLTRVELADSPDESVIMTVFGDGKQYHISMITDETEESWYWNGTDPNEKGYVEIAGNLFPPHQVTSDLEVVRKALMYFYLSGTLSSDLQWISDLVED
jgi:hypothetical protein